MFRTNFLLFITDQHRADHLSCYGNPVVRTPNIDSIAARGTRFERFYVGTPICMPNRATMMTGRMPSLHGARQNGIPLSLTATTFTDLLAAAGYRTALVGKCHPQSMSPALPTVGMPTPDPALAPAPPPLREADKSIPGHGRYDQELASNWKRARSALLRLSARRTLRQSRRPGGRSLFALARRKARRLAIAARPGEPTAGQRLRLPPGVAHRRARGASQESHRACLPD